MDQLNGLGGASLAFIKDLNDLFNHLQAWKRLCNDAQHGIQSLLGTINGKPADYTVATSLDIAFVTAEHKLSEQLRLRNPEQYLRWEDANEALWNSLFVDHGVADAAIVACFEAYLNFFDSEDKEDDASIAAARATRASYLTAQRNLGDRIVADLREKSGIKHHIVQFRRLLLRRKAMFLGRLEALYCLSFKRPEDKKPFDHGLESLQLPDGKYLLEQLIDFVALHKDYAYLQLESFFETANALIHPKKPGPNRLLRTAPTQGLDEYREVKTALEKCEHELQLLAKLDHATWKTMDVDGQYSKLMQERDVLTWAMTERRKELSVKARVIDLATSPKLDKTAFFKAAGILLAKNTGKNVAFALWNSINGRNDKNDWKNIGNELLIDGLGVAALAAVSAFLGPAAGGMASSLLLGVLRPTPPDPYMLEFKQLHKSMDELQESVKEVQKGIVDILNLLEKIYVALPEITVIKQGIQDFETRITLLKSKLNAVITQQKDVFTGKTKNLGDTQLQNTYQEMTQELRGLMNLLWNDEFTFDAATPMAITKQSLVYKLIDTFSKKENHLRFQKTAEMITGLAMATEAVMKQYQQAMQAHRSVLAIALVAFENCDRQSLCTQLIDIQSHDEDISELLVLASIEIRNLIGRKNARLYNTLENYWMPGRHTHFNSLSSFLLKSPKSNTFWAYPMRCQCIANVELADARLYIMPDTANVHSPYKICQPSQAWGHETADVHIALGHDDQLIVWAADDKSPIPLDVAFMEDFDPKSLEAALQQPCIVPLDIAKLPDWPDYNIVDGQLRFFHRDNEFLLLGNAQLLMRVPVTDLNRSSMHGFLRKKPGGVIEIGFATTTDATDPNLLNVVGSIKVDPNDTDNLAWEHWAFDYKTHCDSLHMDGILHFPFDNLRLFLPKKALFAGQAMRRGSYLATRTNHKFTLETDSHMKFTSNDHFENSVWRGNWDFGTQGKASTHLKMQTDGNLVLYNATSIDDQSGGNAVWAASWYKVNIDGQSKDFEMNKGVAFLFRGLESRPSIVDKDGKYIFAAAYGTVRK